MFSPIEQIKSHYTSAIQPVKLFTTNNSETAQKSTFDFINQIQKNNYNPNHPNISNGTNGINLDLLS